MPEANPLVAEHSARRDRRVYVLWGAGFGLLSLLGLVCWGFVRPALNARHVVDGLMRAVSHLSESVGPGEYVQAEVPVLGDMNFERAEVRVAVERLGGSSRAARALQLYLLLPERWAENRGTAIVLLSQCAKPGVTVLLGLAQSADPETRRLAAWSLGHVDCEAPEIVLPLATLLDDRDAKVRLCAAQGLRVLIGSENEMGGISPGLIYREDRKSVV